ncbi:MAG: twin-arginine translocase subunit TatC [Actinomycetota bacterium]
MLRKASTHGAEAESPNGKPSSTRQDPELRTMTLMQHLEELRGRLLKAVAAFAAGSVAGWFLYERILVLLLEPLRKLPNSDQILAGGKLVLTAPQEAFFLRLKVTAFAGLVIAFPLILWQIWRFVAPGLHARERRLAIPFIGLATLLFVGGAWFAAQMLPQALRVLLGFAGSNTVLLPKASEYLSFLLMMIIGFGLSFQVPLALTGLAFVGVISSMTLRKGRRIAWVLILIMSAIITPTVDPYTLMLMAVPIALMYEGAILLSRAMKR